MGDGLIASEVDQTRNLTSLASLIQNTSIVVRGSNENYNSSYKMCTSSDNCLERLYDLLIEPIQEYLPSKDTEEIIFIPYKEIHAIPFSALKKNDRYLIEDHTLRVSPSIRALRLLRQRSENKLIEVSDSLVIGNPTPPSVAIPNLIGTPNLKPLPNAEIEAQEVARLLNTDPLLGADATETNIINRLPTSKYIHLATHGILASPSEQYPAFVLAPSLTNDLPENVDLQISTVNDGFLTTEDIYQTNLNADLAVLSACETNVGEVTVEGNMGLANPFLMNGVPSVIASLWTIPDAPTAELMVDFYENFKSNKNKAKSLRQAMLSTKEKYPEPSNWSGLLLIGLSESYEAPQDPEKTLQVVGKMACSPLFFTEDYDFSARNIVEATFEKSLSGFNLNLMEETGENHLFELDNDLIIQAASTDGGHWNLTTYSAFNTPFTINSDGTFENAIPVSSRSQCVFEGSLRFLNDSDKLLFDQ